MSRFLSFALLLSTFSLVVQHVPLAVFGLSPTFDTPVRSLGFYRSFDECVNGTGPTGGQVSGTRISRPCMRSPQSADYKSFMYKCSNDNDEW